MVEFIDTRLPPDPPALRPDGGAAPALTPRPPPAPADALHIRALDLTGALQILMAEVRAELPLPAGSPAPPAAAPQTVVQLFLQALPSPETLEPAAWLASVAHVQRAVQVALDRAVQAVVEWREVPLAVVRGVTEMRDLAMAAIADDPPNPLWLRPEWLGLAPRMERYWRRRKRARGWLSDPDLRWRERDEDRGLEPPADES